MQVLKSWFHRIILARRWATFLVLGLSFLVFGGASVNLVFLANANLALIAEHGWLALMDGAAQQLAELLFNAYMSMAAYIVFKSCELRLVRWLADPPP
jgi:hypothetical protein